MLDLSDLDSLTNVSFACFLRFWVIFILKLSDLIGSIGTATFDCAVFDAISIARSHFCLSSVKGLVGAGEDVSLNSIGCSPAPNLDSSCGLVVHVNDLNGAAALKHW